MKDQRRYTSTRLTRLQGLLRLVWPAAMAGLSSACSTLVAPPNVAPVTATMAQAAWAQVLKTHVTEQGDVDFPALALAPGDLNAYVRFVADY